MKKLFAAFILSSLLVISSGDHLWAQCTNQVMHTTGTATVGSTSVAVTSAGNTTNWTTYCPAVTQPFFIGYSPSLGSGTGSFTFTFTPAVSGVTLNFSGASNSGASVEEVRLYVNGSHYAMPSVGTASGCDALASLTGAGDLVGCPGCGVSGWSGTTIMASITTLRVEDFVVGGTPNGALFSLFICNGVLPAEWLQFNADFSPSGAVNLDWATSTETNNDYFTIERSADGDAWEAIGEMDAVGNSQTIQSYVFTDPAPLPGSNQYRIRQTSLDGSGTYSETRNILTPGSASIRISPNPAKDFVQVEGLDAAQATVMLCNHLGQAVQVPVTRSADRIVLNTSSLPQGVYFLRVNDGAQTAFMNVILE